MENSANIIRGLNTPNITRRMLISETVSLVIIIVVMNTLAGFLIWTAINEIIETLDFLILIPVVLSFIPLGILEGVIIFLLVSSFRARKEVFLLVKNNDYLTLQEFLSLEDFTGQHKMKQKDLFKMKYTIAVFGDLQLERSLNYLIAIMFCQEPLSFGLRRWSSIAIAKIGSAEAIQALIKASSLFRNPNSSMYPQPVSYKMSTAFFRKLHSFRAYLAVRNSLNKLKKKGLL
ncbi:MAG TPA: hypothetical protein VMZ29_15080 [Candidatus Bathyarchaeia archaeon]|nr:hypothetical protein [Candidatus Bathyarchaeia archaeon]